jgi:hypothetical protein
MFHLKGSTTWIKCRSPQVFFNAQELVVLGNPISSRKRAGLDLTRVCSDRQVSYKGIFRLTRTMRDNGGPPVCLRKLNAIQSFGERSNLIYFDQD